MAASRLVPQNCLPGEEGNSAAIELLVEFLDAAALPPFLQPFLNDDGRSMRLAAFYEIERARIRHVRVYGFARAVRTDAVSTVRGG